MAALPGAVAGEDSCACPSSACLQFDQTIEINGALSSRRLRYTDDEGYDYRSYFLTFDSPHCIARAGSDFGFVSEKIQIVPNADYFEKGDFKEFEGQRARIRGGLVSAYREDHLTPTLLIADQIE